LKTEGLSVQQRNEIAKPLYRFKAETGQSVMERVRWLRIAKRVRS
jgi:hypothetical protein